MHHQINFAFLPLFPVFFATMWLVVGLLLGFWSGWYDLARRYPDNEEPPLFMLRYQSGRMGWKVYMRGILTLCVCKTGLRVGMMRVFGPACRSFFVPWSDITITRKEEFLWNTVTLAFGHPAIGKLAIDDHVANRLARRAQGHWPEVGTFPPETAQTAFGILFKQWAAVTLLAGTFFYVAPRLLSHAQSTSINTDNFPSLLAAFLFPASLFAVVSFVRLLIRVNRARD